MYIHVKVTAGARKEELLEKSADHFLVCVREKAERNLANIRVLEILANYFGVAASQVRIVNGHRSPSKLLYIEK